MTEKPRPETANSISGKVEGTALQIGALHGDMYVGVEREVPSVAVNPPVGWSDLPELPSKIVSLLRAQIQNAEKMPYQLRGARRTSLATVYVRQEVTTKTDVEPADQRRPLPVLDSKGRLIDVPYPPVARLTVRPPSRKMQDALDGGDHMLVTGGPGQGKSTLSLRLAADVALRWRGTGEEPPLSEPVIPLRLTARELATRLELPFYEALAETVRGEYGALLAQPLHPADLQHRIAGCRWLLLVDGLDEVADTVVRDRLVAVLATWASDATAAYRVVLTTRPIEGATLAPFQRIGAARYELLPFDEEAFRLFAENWFSDSGEKAKKFVRQIRDAHLDELVRVPLLATIAAIIFEKYADRPLPDNQYELYETYLGYLKTGHDAPRGPFDVHCEQLLEYLGRIRLVEDTSLAAAACRWVAEHLPELGQGTEWEEQLVIYLGAVGPFLRRDGDLRFLHHSFAEHLAATAKARQLPAVFDAAHQDFADLLHAAKPEERGRYARRVLLHHTRLYPAEADQLIKHLHAGEPEQQLLAARLLAWHAPAGRDVVDAFLATARAWAGTTQPPARAILSQVSRAVHHPGLVDWLRGLMEDSNAPWRSRVEAAVALTTRINSDVRAEAMSVLRFVVNEADIPVRCRLDAAEALSQCGTGERDVAVLGLRSVLSVPSATSEQYCDAAVVLAGMGGDGRKRAVDALVELLDDTSATDLDLAVAAVALSEIDAEFHDRSAGVFRKILHRRSWSVDGVEKAALGLASLGPDLLGEAAAALELRIADSRLHCYDRFLAARVLLQLGPQHRLRATELIHELTAGSVGGTLGRAYIASLLADCGPDFHGTVAALLPSVLKDPSTSFGELHSAGQALVNLGAAHRPEAVRALVRVADHPLATVAFRMSALGRLIELGEPHREFALAKLHAAMVNPVTALEIRRRAVAEISQLGPQFHPVAIEQLNFLAMSQISPKIRIWAWRQLKKLRPGLESQASREVLRMVEAFDWEPEYERVVLLPSDVEDLEALASALERVVHDQARDVHRRHEAALTLFGLGRRYHGRAVHGLAELIRAGAFIDSEIVAGGRQCTSASDGTRAEMMAALREIVFDRRTRPERLCLAVEAMEALDALEDREVVGRLRTLAADGSAAADSRSRAVIILLRNGEVQPSEAAALILGLWPWLDSNLWISRLQDIVTVGVDVAGELCAMAVDRDVPCYVHQRAALVLARARPEMAGEAASALLTQTTDPYLHLTYRANAMVRLASADPGEVPEATAVLRAMMADERYPIDQRCKAAYELVTIDQAAAEQARRMLLHLAVKPELTPRERGVALSWLGYFRPEDPVVVGMGAALSRDPAASDEVRARALDDLPAKVQREAGRTLVLDRMTSPANWPDRVNRWNNLGLAVEAEQLLRELFDAPELTSVDRVAAAVALSKLSPKHEAEAVRHLIPLSSGGVSSRGARRELASLSPEWHARVLADAGAILADGTRAGRDRANAGLLVVELTSELSAQVRAHLEELVADRKIAQQLRTSILCELRRFEELRTIRDDRHELPIIRRMAANLLRDLTTEDRVAAVELLSTIANDRSCHPRLRWWAADDLAEYGVRGHELGTALLRRLMADEALPISARRDAARALGQARPDLRAEALDLLRRISITRNPHTRMDIWDAIGVFEPHEGALGFLDMARDRALSPVVRCRSARAAAYLDRDHREAAAVVAREIAHDAEVPRHIRISAARLLARASELCRPEARQLLKRLL